MRIDQIELTGSLSISSSLAASPLRVNKTYLFVSNTGNVGIGTNNPTSKLAVTGSASIRGGIKATTASGSFTFNESLFSIDTTTGLKIPVGTTAQRPSSPTTGSIRYNTTTSALEIHLSGRWQKVSVSDYTVMVDYLVVAGGGGGGQDRGGGGGAGGFRQFTNQNLNKGTSYTVTVGGGGAGSTNVVNKGVNGNSSTFNSNSSTGGGGGGSSGNINGNSGGSGGGGWSISVGTPGSGGNGNTGSYSPVEGYAGGIGEVGGNRRAGGGGGASEPGNTDTQGFGGDGLSATITGIIYAGGGGGGVMSGGGGTGGDGGGGNGGALNTGGSNGLDNRGAGGGGAGDTSGSGGNGGSGVIIIRATIQAASTTGSPTYTTSGSYHIYQFNGDGSITY